MHRVLRHRPQRRCVLPGADDSDACKNTGSQTTRKKLPLLAPSLTPQQVHCPYSHL